LSKTKQEEDDSNPMSYSNQISPRSEALKSILEVRDSIEGASIDADTWDMIVGIAWDTRAQVGDRREIQRVIRATLLESTREGR
jgi:hypothetical protein